jgi:hypothetical protein
LKYINKYRGYCREYNRTMFNEWCREAMPSFLSLFLCNKEFTMTVEKTCAIFFWVKSPYSQVDANVLESIVPPPSR